MMNENNKEVLVNPVIINPVIKKKTKTEKLRENPWIGSTFILGLIILIFLGYVIYTQIDSGILTNNKIIKGNLTAEEVCPQIKVVPSWIKGNEIIEGFSNFNNETPKNIIDGLINNQIYFVYSSTCPVCEKQKELFGDELKRYIDSGYTIQCG